MQAIESCLGCNSQDFVPHPGNGSRCIPCVAAYSAKWHQDNKERTKKRRYQASRRFKIKRERELHERVDKMKTAPCLDCKLSYPPWVMQFDHIGNDKVDNVATMVHNLKPLDTILKEIFKCELVCANCHADRTYRRRNPNT